MKTEMIILNEDRKVSLTAYIQETGGEFEFQKRPAMLILPGGGYAMCSEREADPVAMAYLKAGYQVFILRYTIKKYGGWPLPLKDYEEAMKLIVQRADEWHVEKNKIAIVGFSAGGHLAACAATISKYRPAAAILVYPAILKEIVDVCQSGLPYPVEHVSKKTAPCFIVAARDDQIVPVMNSIKFMEALAENQVTFESRIYSYGGHGFSTAEEYLVGNKVCPRLPCWVFDSTEWLKEVLGNFSQKGVGTPLYASLISGDLQDYLSLECTLAHIRKQSEEVHAVLAGVFEIIKEMAHERNIEEERFLIAIGGFKVREILEMIQVPPEEFQSLDNKLRTFENQK